MIAFASFLADAKNPKTPLSLDEIPDTLDRGVDLKEVVVKPKREKYTKRNNPAVDFVNRLRDGISLADPMEEDYFNYEKYERRTLALNDVKDSIGGGNSGNSKFKFLREYVDTSYVTGKPILPISVKEKVSQVLNRKNPKKSREYVIANRQTGLDDFTSEDNMTAYLEEIFREIDLFDGSITLLGNRFVSPLSKIGPDFYKYYLTDTIAVPRKDYSNGQNDGSDGTPGYRPLDKEQLDTMIVLAFAPRNNATFGFNGRLYVQPIDSTLFIKRAVLTLPRYANINFIDWMQIEQAFDRDSVGHQIKTLDNLTMEFSVIKGTQSFYIQKYTTMHDHSFEPDNSRDYLYDYLGETVVATDAELKPEGYWDAYRGDKMHRAERHISNIVEGLRKVPLFYWSEQVLKTLVTGYVPVWKDRLLLGPVNTLVSFNSVEGARFRVGGMTASPLSKHWFGKAFLAYGTKDRKFKYLAELEYSFNAKKNHAREFPVHSLRLTSSYDVDALGQSYAFTNPDNIFISLKRMPDTLMTYVHRQQLEYMLELENNFSVSATLATSRQEASKYVPFNFADGTSADHFRFNTATITLRYAPGEKFFQTKSERFPMTLDAPIFMLSHTYGPARFLGSSTYVINKTELNFQKRFWLSAFGYIDAVVKGAHVWSSVPFTQLAIPNANLSYTIQPESFALLSPMEFMTDSYAAIDLTYWANGLLFNYIPILKKLKLREAICFRGFIGALSDKNNPEKTNWLPQFPKEARPADMHGLPYMEFSVGIDNIFKIVRLDYVWRLTYRDSPGGSNSGLRLAAHFSF